MQYLWANRDLLYIWNYFVNMNNMPNFLIIFWAYKIYIPILQKKICLISYNIFFFGNKVLILFNFVILFFLVKNKNTILWKYYKGRCIYHQNIKIVFILCNKTNRNCFADQKSFFIFHFKFEVKLSASITDIDAWNFFNFCCCLYMNKNVMFYWNWCNKKNLRSLVSKHQASFFI